MSPYLYHFTPCTFSQIYIIIWNITHKTNDHYSCEQNSCVHCLTILAFTNTVTSSEKVSVFYSDHNFNNSFLPASVALGSPIKLLMLIIDLWKYPFTSSLKCHKWELIAFGVMAKNAEYRYVNRKMIYILISTW